MKQITTNYWAPTLIILIAIACVHPVLWNGWVNWDDYNYITNNHYLFISDLESFKDLIFHEPVVGTYLPITLFSYALNVSWTGFDPFYFHLTDLFIHLVNCLLVWMLMLRLTHRPWMAFCIGILFATYPTHVESVAWASGRKDLLSAFFFLSILNLYTSELIKTRRNLLILAVIPVLYTLCLASKASLLLLPILLLVFDWIRSGRLQRSAILEKVPLFIIASLFAFLAYHGQLNAGALNIKATTLSQDLILGTANITRYLIISILPFKLSPFHPEALGFTSVIWSYALALLSIFLLVCTLVLHKRMSKFVLVGVAFFILTIAPHLQYIPYGEAVIAERYTYLSSLGIWIFVGAALVEAINHSTKREFLTRVSKVVFMIYVIGLFVLSRQQTWNWQSGISLWSKVTSVYPEHYLGHVNLAQAYLANDQTQMAQKSINKALELRDSDPELFLEKGRIEESVGNVDEAEIAYKKALSLNASYVKAYGNLGKLISADTARLEESQFYLNKAIELDPQYERAYLNLGVLLETQGKRDSAIQVYTNGLVKSPSAVRLLQYRGTAHYLDMSFSHALEDYSKGLTSDPINCQLLNLRAKLLFDMEHFRRSNLDITTMQKFNCNLDESFVKKLRAQIPESDME